MLYNLTSWGPCNLGAVSALGELSVLLTQVTTGTQLSPVYHAGMEKER